MITNAQICLSGHVVSTDIQESSAPFCSECGEKTITACPHCNAPIPGVLKDDEVIILGQELTYEPPKYCEKCGTPFPWTKK